MSSDIWDEFEKLAVAQGLVSVAEEEEREQEDASKMPARYDSISNDAIRLLYGLEPESIYEKGKSIIEIAHPETAIINRTYDAMNAVVENLHQRQDMMAHIALKMPSGHLTQHRYVAAKGDLVKAITRAAFTLDHKDEDELMTLADSCAERLVKGADIKKKSSLNKEAWVPLVAGGAALLGAAYYLFYGSTTAQNVYANANQVLEELADLSDRPYAATIKKDVEKIKTMAEQVYEAKGELSRIKSVDDATDYTEKQKANSQAIATRIKSYVAQLGKVEQAIPGWVAAIEADHSVGKEESSDWWAKMRGIQEYLPDFMRSDKDQLIEKLWGKRGITDSAMGLVGGPSETASQHSGGLLGAIQKDRAIMNTLMQRAEAQTQQREVEKVQETPAIQPTQPAPAPEPAPVPQQVASAPKQQSQFTTQTPQFSTQMPSPQADWVIPSHNSAPAAPTGGGAANVRPVGFAGLPSWE